ncbi:quinoprotein glucose dehydrogenase [Saonia flava]|uniref:Quinoprotein glucose dehydrogenase n=1 Tax=Saonia flava TaxID=523696 RepID=A0A846QW49_9FLAO|nr:pyrroloquinoline quinone-dependent dehydrogenase [Saonia flava]NJB71457.1 quinoprotein glucose dehydrogenase [Saonia flava]
MKNILLVFVFMASVLISCSKNKENVVKEYTTWSSYLGGSDRNHYSKLSQITPENVKKLKLAWSYSAIDSGQMQMSPIIVDTMVYGVTAAVRAVAIHAETGREIWRFGDSLKVWHSTSRGVSYWEKDKDKRVFYTRGEHLFALDALTGKPISSFGENGKIDLRKGFPESAKDKFIVSNTPGTVFKDLIIMPTRVSENAGAAPGDIRAFNVLTGDVEWAFHTIPYPDEPGSETWENKNARTDEFIGGANNWAGMSLDEETGIVYVPTGTASPDFYGWLRLGSNLYSNCLLALDASTGKLLWHYQFTHHDLWDRDLPAPPNLITVNHDGVKIKAVAQVTKQGYVYLFDRKTGKPLFDIEERPVPASSLNGEEAWPTQPFPTMPRPFARQSEDLTENDISPYAENKEELKELFLKADKRTYAPPNTNPVLLMPGYDGAAEWGGTAADPNDGIIYVNSNEMAWILQMEKNDVVSSSLTLGERTYLSNCATCHQKNREGLPASGFPSLINIKDKLTKNQIEQTIINGKGMMTGFPQINGDEKEALLRFLLGLEIKHSVGPEINSENISDLPYKHMGYNKFLDSNGLPAISPPWGTLHAIDMNSGEFIWSIPFGETPHLKEQGFPTTGTENYGGAVVTENGLLFIAATKDGFFRAIDKHTGEILWEYELPAPAFATPATYEVNGKQFVVIACGGEKLGTKKGNQIVAFALD